MKSLSCCGRQPLSWAAGRDSRKTFSSFILHGKAECATVSVPLSLRTIEVDSTPVLPPVWVAKVINEALRSVSTSQRQKTITRSAVETVVSQQIEIRAVLLANSIGRPLGLWTHNKQSVRGLV